MSSAFWNFCSSGDGIRDYFLPTSQNLLEHSLSWVRVSILTSLSSVWVWEKANHRLICVSHGLYTWVYWFWSWFWVFWFGTLILLAWNTVKWNHWRKRSENSITFVWGCYYMRLFFPGVKAKFWILQSLSLSAEAFFQPIPFLDCRLPNTVPTWWADALISKTFILISCNKKRIFV